MLLKACLNGNRLPDEHPRLPVTPAQLAASAAGAVAAGAGAVHVHPKDDDGRDTLDAVATAGAVGAIREAVPGVPVGVTTGAWIDPDPDRRAAAIAGWTVRPDFASVNWHEPGATDVASALLRAGVDVEAGLWWPAAAEIFLGGDLVARTFRILLEPTEAVPPDAIATGERLLAMVADLDIPVLLHGQHDGSAWPVLRRAVELGLDSRIGLEDTLVDPYGEPAVDNAALVRSARRIIDASATAQP